MKYDIGLLKFAHLNGKCVFWGGNLSKVGKCENLMTRYAQRVDAINLHLAKLLSELGVDAFVEKFLDSRNIPEITFQLSGLRVVIEANLEDVKETNIYKKAHRLVYSNIAQIAVAIIYPKELKKASTKEISDRLAKCHLKYRILPESNSESAWKLGTPESIIKDVRKIQENLKSVDTVVGTTIIDNEKWEGVVHKIEDNLFAVDLYDPDDVNKIPKCFVKLKKDILTEEEQLILKVGSIVNLNVTKKLSPEKEIDYDLDAQLHNPPEMTEDEINKEVEKLEELFAGIDWNGSKTPK